MGAKRAVLTSAVLLSVAALVPVAQSAEGTGARDSKPVMITRFFTGPDGLTHAEEIDVKFAPGGGAYNLLANSGAQIRRTPPGRENGYHTASRRQYVITLSGHAELVLSGDKQFKSDPAASNWRKTSPAKVTSPERSGQRIASPF
jgi:quercetin dioxygenase-like cupin family protein